MDGGGVGSSEVGDKGKLKVERELLPMGQWRRWIVQDPSANGRRLLLSLLDEARGSRLGVDPEQLERRARRAANLVHPGLSRVVEVGRGQVGVWVIEEAADGLPLSDVPAEDVPDGPALTRGLVGVIETIAYIRRHGLVHGEVSADTVFCCEQGLELTGVAAAPLEESGSAGAAAENIRGWGQVGRQLLEQTLGPGRAEHPLAGVLESAARAGQPDAPSDGPQMAALVHEALASGRGETAPRGAHLPGAAVVDRAAEESGRAATVLGALAAIVRGLLATVLTIALIVGAATGGVLWALARGPAEIGVPNLIGMTRTDASKRLTEAGLREGRLREVYRDDTAAGKVAASTPPVGMRVRQGREVGLTVSLGAAQVPVPKLVGLQVSEAETQLRGQGLKLRRDAHRRSAAPVGEIVQQKPPAGERVGHGAEVGVVVSGGEDYGTLRVVDADGDERDVVFRRLEIIVPQGDRIQRVQVREGYGDNLRVTYDRPHRPGERVTVNTYGFEGKRIEVQIEGVKVFNTRL